ncbi:sensor histidine kinase [Rhabdochromatium marinum]|uniref:sensor histidine kinase n=1 Tax=Rhabdochromatium marinum TaxID=48729 RepID=UPI0019042A58|nr:HAMP domain-containing sensor histidine kinase [Rhabdochromatium marinum]MBK1647212.1 two-component sensor histidine kinase [Rhabdochromatium marinum]
MAANRARSGLPTATDALNESRAQRRLRFGIGLFVLAVAIPSALLVFKAYDQMQWESFRAQQLVAEELAARIDTRLAALVRREATRPISDYDFLHAPTDTTQSANMRSPLAALHDTAALPGLIGYFEVAPDGRFHSPLLPEQPAAQRGLDPAELAQRQARAQRIQQVLIGNRLIERAWPETRQVEFGATDQEMTEAEPAASGNSLAAAGASISALAPTRPSAPAPAPAATPPMEESPRLSQAAFARLKTQDRAARGAPSQPARASKALPQLDESYAKRSRREQSPTLFGDAAELANTTAAGADKSLAKLTLEHESEQTKEQVQKQEQKQTPASPAKIQLFHRMIGPVEVGLLDSGHLLLFRSVQRSGEVFIQGALIALEPFLHHLIAEPLAATVLARSTHLSVAYRGDLLSSFRAAPTRSNSFTSSRSENIENDINGIKGINNDNGTRSNSLSESLSGALLYRSRLQEPFGGFELIFSVSHLPTPPGAKVIGWMAGALALVLLVGAGLMYRLGTRQLALLRQQQDFVSAVSHELKTPLTSIRMYAEMLRAGFASEERKATYYRFIQEESERLSRLINNVLQLARIGRQQLRLEPCPLAVSELLAMVRERVAYQLERADFSLRIGCTQDFSILADPDASVQILLNLLDNALKFGAAAKQRRIDIDCEPLTGGNGNHEQRLRLRIRDYGPGIPRAQRQRIFELFYRGDLARTAAISGTGIGLALVQRLTLAMHGRIEVIECDPGVEFWLELPCPPQGQSSARE